MPDGATEGITRIAHATDIHWMEPPYWKVLNSKRVLGTANLYLRGRRHHFTDIVQKALIEHILGLEPDLVLLTGDLTAQALPGEFEKAREALDPVLQRFPTFIIPGNHDVYTLGARRDRRIHTWFADWMGLDGEDPVGRLDVGDITCLGLDPNRPTWLGASGLVPPEQLVSLERTLADPALRDRLVILCLHYPVLDRRGEVYDGRNHGLLNARELIEVLDRAPVKPALMVHGHEHHGFHVELPLSGGAVPIYNSGSSGYAFMPTSKRAAAMNVYQVQGARLVGVERYLYDGETFAPEPGGAYATGR